jgi:predicted transposase/invertase (TIGR01784 family)
MEPRLQTFYETDDGLRQFCARYGHAVATVEVREAYNRWYIGQMRDWGEMDGARQEGIQIGRGERNVAIARKLLMRGLPVYDIAEDTGLSIAEVEQLRGNTQ